MVRSDDLIEEGDAQFVPQVFAVWVIPEVANFIGIFLQIEELAILLT